MPAIHLYFRILLLNLVCWFCYISKEFWQNLICIIDSNLLSWIQSHSHGRNVAFLFHFYKYIDVNCFDELSSLISWLHEFKCSSRLVARPPNFTVETASCKSKFYSNSFFFQHFSLIEHSSGFYVNTYLQKI